MAFSNARSSNIRYRVQIDNVHAHLWLVTLFLAKPNSKQKFQLPVWIPGSYMVREFSKQISGMQASQLGQSLTVRQLDKCTWETQNRANQPMQLQYHVHAHDHSVRTAWLDSNRGFFNGTSLFVQVVGLSEQAIRVELVPPTHTSHWKVATALTPLRVNTSGFGVYKAAHYDELADSPVEMADFNRTEFSIVQSKHSIVVSGAAPSLDAHQLQQDVEKICSTIVNFWHPGQSPPFKNYVFLLNAVNDGYGGLEHRNSTALLCRRKDLPKLGEKKRGDDYIGLLGLFSHEYFHAWNVKRLRPLNYERYGYQSEQYTDMLWFFEGFTDYYDNLMLCRAELISPAQYLKLLNKSVQQYLQTPGRHIHTVAESSFEAWTKYYRPDSNTPNLTVSYYTKGSLVAMCLDLSLRQIGFSLDEVMRELWSSSNDGPISETDVTDALQSITGKSWRKKLHAWVHTTDELPLQEVLSTQGIDVQFETSPLAQQLGLRVKEDHSVQVHTVFRDSAAEQAGFAPGDEWLGVEIGKGRNQQSWRLQRLDQLNSFLGNSKNCIALISRDGLLMRLSLSVPMTDPTPLWRLHIKDATKVGQWLSGAHF
jgi:predicted metalloprotease with PDZ domain